MALETKLRSLRMEADPSTIDKEARTVVLSVSSDSPDILSYIPGKGTGYEVLDHSSLASIDLTRFAGDNGGPLLVDHDLSTRSLVGRFTPTEVRNGKLYGTARFGNSELAEQTFRDVCERIVTDTSARFCYDPEDVVVDPSHAAHDDYPTYRVRKWTLLEASLVAVPADTKTGVGRALAPISTPTEEAPVDIPPTQAASRSAHQEVHMDPITQAGETANTNTALEVLQLRSIADKYGKGREAEEILGAKPIGEARGLIMGLLANAQTPAPAPSLESLGASERERKGYSYARALRAAYDTSQGRVVSRSFETEVSEDLGKRMPASFERGGGVLIPFRVNETRAMDFTSGNGGELVTTTQGELIDLLRARVICQTLGATVLDGLMSPVRLPKVTSGAEAYWLDEGAVQDSEVGTGGVLLSPRVMLANVPVSVSLLQLSNPSVEQIVRNSLANVVARKLDSTALTSSKGIYGAAGVNKVTFGAYDPATAYEKALAMVAKSASKNAIVGSLAWATNPLVAAKLMATLEFPNVNGASKLWTGSITDGLMVGYKSMASNQMPTNLGTSKDENGLAFGDWSTISFGLFGPGLEIKLNPYRRMPEDLVEITSRVMADVALQHEEAFTIATGLTLA